MLRTAEQAARIIEAKHPLVADCLEALSAAGVQYAIVGSQAARWASLMLGNAASLKAPDDWDIQVLPEHFELAAQITHATVERSKTFDTVTSYGSHVRLTADEALAQIGKDTIQFLYPHGPVHIGRAVVDTRFTAEAFAASKLYGKLRFADYTESAMLYGIRQGDARMGKQDLERAAAIHAAHHHTGGSQAQSRAKQVSRSRRLRSFDAAATRRALQLLASTPLAV